MNQPENSIRPKKYWGKMEYVLRDYFDDANYPETKNKLREVFGDDVDPRAKEDALEKIHDLVVDFLIKY